MEDGHRLHLLRHAKSSWDDDALPDAERPLSPRGRKAASALRRHFKASQLRVDLVLCSPARRTRQTWDRVRDGVRCTEVRFVPDIYEASAGALLDVVRGIDESAGSVLLIGHNPGLADLAEQLIADGRDEAVTRLREGFPTGAFATMRLNGPWRATDPHTGFLEGFVRPRDLPER
ncbi:MAG TPA: histidine phosphatase family protein [Jatrophihabitans sp.]|nr:histidine phosphatase family protein [Jatrophihabitans sp.]